MTNSICSQSNLSFFFYFLVCYYQYSFSAAHSVKFVMLVKCVKFLYLEFALIKVNLSHCIPNLLSFYLTKYVWNFHLTVWLMWTGVFEKYFHAEEPDGQAPDQNTSLFKMMWTYFLLIEFMRSARTCF